MFLHPKGVERVQPGVSTPGTSSHGGAPRRGARSNVATTQVKCVRISRPFRANHLFGWFPGLKPWAESYSPLRGKNYSKFYLKLVPFTYGVNPWLSIGTLGIVRIFLPFGPLLARKC
jgi:hypothetical protein